MVSDPSDTEHDDAMFDIIRGLNPTATVDTHFGSLQVAVQYALDNGYAIVSRSTTGLDDSDNPAGQDMIDNGGIIVHAHGSNGYYEQDETYTDEATIVAIRDVDGSWGGGSEFTLTEYTSESECTAYAAGKFLNYGIAHPTLSYTQIRLQLRADSSNGGVVDPITGYGTPDWDATEIALSAI